MIIEKFEVELGDVSFVIVLMMFDDSGSVLVFESICFCVCQNVLYEFGYFVGKFGCGKVFVFRKGDIEIFLDFVGVFYIEFDEYGGWKCKLLSEFVYVGVFFDKDKVLSV